MAVTTEQATGEGHTNSRIKTAGTAQRKCKGKEREREIQRDR